ncbi:MAG: response regulator transcription factor [Methylotenera sp.]|jgi:two-component system OmpR family response regulator
MRILLVEDDEILGDAIFRSLTKSHYAVDWLKDGHKADLALHEQIYDAIVLDIGLPHISGFELLKRLRARNIHSPVIVLTAKEGLDDIVNALDLGADDYLSKPFKLPELEARLRAHIRRANAITSSLIEFGALLLDTKEHTVTIDNKPLNLSQREFNLLESLLAKVGKVVGKEYLIENLCAWDKELGINAIEVYIHRLRKKLEPYNIIIITVRGLGYMLDKKIEG